MAHAIVHHEECTSSPGSLRDRSSSPRADATCVERRVEQHAIEADVLQPSVFTPVDPNFAAGSPDGCTGPGPVLTLGSPAVRKWKPRRLRQEGAVEVDLMTSDTRGLWHADTIRSAVTPPRDAKSATGVLGLVLTTWRLASTDAGRKEALGLHDLECRRLQAGTFSGFVEYLRLATAAGAECRVVLGSRVTTHSNDLKAINSKKKQSWAEPQPG